MIERRKKLHRILSVVIISFLLVSVLSPVAGLYNDSGSPGTSFNNDGIDPRAEGDYRNITGTVYINTSIEPDYHIIVKSTGKLYINNATLSFLIDGYHPWKLTVENGGELYMWNSTIRTQPDDTQLRPFLKTAVIVTGGSKLVMRHNSAFTFPGWVYIEDGSTFMMQDSRFDQIPDLDDYQHDFNWDGELTAIDEDDNDDCPILHVTDNSKAIIQDSVIDNYYENDVFEQQNNIPSWAPRDNFAQPMSSLTEVDNDYYEISPGDSLEIEDFNMTNPLFPTPDMYPYMNPINKMSSLYIEITYQTEDNYSFMDSLEYETPSGWKNALSIAPTDQSETLASNIWEIPLTNFTFSGDQFLYKIPARLNNSDSGSNANISVDQIRLVSGYENDIHVRNSETVVINSEIDVDFNPSDIDPRPGDNYEEMTTQSNWMEDSNTDHSCFRLMNSGFKAYGIVPTGTSTPDGSPPPEGDPIVAADTASQDKIWIYRWLTVVPRDNTGTAVADTNVTIELEEDFQNVWPNLAAKVQGANDPFNNSDAWEYINKTGIGEYDPINEYYRTKGSGRVLCFAASDRINHPGDWPNSRSVGSYNITADHHILGYADKDVGLTSFPNLTAHSNNVDVELQFDGEIPHPDIAVSDDSLSIMHDGNTVSYVTTDTQLYLNLSVLNAGTENATNVKVNYYLNSVEASNLLGSDTISFLNMTETKVTSISWTPVSTGDYTIMAVADPDDDIPELNEMNNTANQTITVGNKADLVVNDVIVSDNEVMNGETVSVYATIGNLGGTDVDNLNVSFYYDGMTYFDTSFINVPGNTTYRTTETLNFPYPGVGDYTITVIADADDQVEEGNENNNDNTAEVSVLSEPDLIPSGFRILNESGSQVSSVYDGETVTLETRVSNVGGASTSTIPVTFYVDRGEPTQEAIGTIYVSGLTPGSTSSYYS
ncbi:MAG: CARDB domain-containing protein, partial [Thermoplasmata archaeon]